HVLTVISRSGALESWRILYCMGRASDEVAVRAVMCPGDNPVPDRTPPTPAAPRVVTSARFYPPACPEEYDTRASSGGTRRTQFGRLIRSVHLSKIQKYDPTPIDLPAGFTECEGYGKFLRSSCRERAKWPWFP